MSGSAGAAANLSLVPTLAATATTKTSHTDKTIRKNEDYSDKFEDDEDWRLPIAFNRPRHTAVIEGVNCVSQSWRMKERVS